MSSIETQIYTNENSKTYCIIDHKLQTREAYTDRGIDGTIDSKALFYEDENGNTLKGFYDNDGNGKYDEVSLFEYDNSGNITRRYDGAVTYSLEYCLDENGEYVDRDGDGAPDIYEVKHEKYNQFVDFSTDEEGDEVESEPKELTGWLRLSVEKRSLTLDLNHKISKINTECKLSRITRN